MHILSCFSPVMCRGKIVAMNEQVFLTSMISNLHTGHGSGADPGFDQGGGAQIVTGLKLPFWGLSFVEFWCWGLIFGGQGGPGAPPLIRPCGCSL